MNNPALYIKQKSYLINIK